MTTYNAPLEDQRFALFDVFGADMILPRLLDGSEHTRDLLDAVLEEAGKFSEHVLAPVNQHADLEGCHFDKNSGSVTTPKGFKEAFHTFAEGGWAGLTVPTTWDGQGLPNVLGSATNELMQSGNLAWSLYPMLSEGACHALQVHGTSEQQEKYLKPIVAGRWTGTMCLTEPQAGSDLGLLKTSALPEDDGSYAIYGSKIFISAGEHDLTENIIHLVLARLPDAPPGSRGISMFIVPKFKLDANGNPGERNRVFAGSIEHKMGIHGCSTCVMNFDAAQAYLIGKPHQGLIAMFTMMNAARLAVGIQGLAVAERALQNSLSYASSRIQGRALSGIKFADKAADPLLVQPDVRRMLLTQRALVEGSRMLLLYTALQTDIEARAENEIEREKAGEMVAFLIPIAKGMVTEWAQECTKEALQVYGGHGFIREHGMEQFVRDARITTLYEGTTGIQALDLLGRKIRRLQGTGFKHFLDIIERFCSQHAGHETLGDLIETLHQASQTWRTSTLRLLDRIRENPEEMGAAATDYLWYCGYLALAYFWALAVISAEHSSQTPTFKQAKRDTARFYFARILPRAWMHQAAIEAGVKTLPDISASSIA